MIKTTHGYEKNATLFNISTMKLKLIKKENMRYRNESSNDISRYNRIICHIILLLNKITHHYNEKDFLLNYYY